MADELKPLPLASIKSVTLERLIKEVRNTTPDTIHAYDRVHTRHNR